MSDARPEPDAPKIRLYTQSLNPFSQKVAAALALKGLAFERVVSDDPEDIQRWSPIARILPVLEIDGRRKSESMKIVSWLDELFPDPPLYSPELRIAETQRQIAQWSEDSFLWYWNRWRTSRFPQPGDEKPIDDSIVARIRDGIGRTLGHSPKTRADLRELEVIQKIEERMDDLVGFLRDRHFFHADEPSIADLSVYSMLLVMHEGGIPGCAEALAERPTLAAFVDRMAGRIKSLEYSSD